MEKFEERLLNEKEELDARIEKLTAFFDSGKSQVIQKIQHSLLIVQLQAMKTYRLCLHERLVDLISYK